MASYWMVGMVTMEATPWAQEENFARMEEYVREAVRRRVNVSWEGSRPEDAYLYTVYLVEGEDTK